MKNFLTMASTLFIVACISGASNSINISECNEKTVYKQLDCSMKNLEIKEQILDNLSNKSRSDYQIWESNVIKNCESDMRDQAVGESMSNSLECKHRLYDKRINILKTKALEN